MKYIKRKKKQGFKRMLLILPKQRLSILIFKDKNYVFHNLKTSMLILYLNFTINLTIYSTKNIIHQIEINFFNHPN